MPPRAWRRKRVLLWLGCMMAVVGCRAHPVSLAISLVERAGDRRDVRERTPLLLGKGAAAADRMFGPRHDTLVDVNTGAIWLIYREPNENFSESFYVVEMSPEQRTTALVKCKRNTDGLEDVRKHKKLAKRVYGKTPLECEQITGLGVPTYVMRSEVNGAVARFYRVRDWSHHDNNHYCVLIFGKSGLCEDVRLMGVTARSEQSSTGVF